MRGSFRIGRIFGIQISIHYTWILAVSLIAWSLAQGFFPQLYPTWETGTYWVISIISALMLFVSVLIHELAHSLIARTKGIAVEGITLFIFGGVSNLKEEPRKPGSEFAVAIAGPLSSVILSMLFWGLQYSIGTGNEPFSALLGYLALINILLAAFNILPGFPLDGGRVLRAVIWGATGNLTKATNIAAITGQVFGWIFIGIGLFQILTGNFLNGIWIAFIGWFLNSAADASRQEMTLQQHLKGVKVHTVMKRNPETITPHLLVTDLVHRIFLQGGIRAVAVCQDDQYIGIVTLADVKKIAEHDWHITTVDRIMTREPIYSVKPDDELAEAFKLLAIHHLNQIPVLLDNKIVGMLSRADIIGYLQLSQELKQRQDKNQK